MPACPACHLEIEDDAVRYCSRCGSDVKSRPPADGGDAWIGGIVDGRYRVIARIGAGGMGAVYRVEHVRMGKVAAMKVLHRELAGDSSAIKRFRREVEAVSRLNHPNIVQTFDFGYWQGLLYLIMEYVKGEDLGAILRSKGPMPFSRAAPLFAQVCSALDEAHHLAVIHRDMKPENIVCVRRRRDEHAKVLDFGLAKLRERSDLAEITSKGSIIGSPHYMAPEQASSEPVDARSDIYSVGATLYRVLTGAYPFEGDSALAIAGKHLNETLVPPSRRAPQLDLPPEADAIVMRAMARNRQDRFASAAELRQALEAAVGGAALPRILTPARGAAGDDEILPLQMLEGQGTPAEEGERMRREDFDAFERRPRRRIVSTLFAPALLGALVAIAWATYRLVGPRPSQAEVEPNDEPRTANPLPSRAPVYGHIGPPATPDQPDMDYFKIPRGEGARAVVAHASGIPDVDLVLELYDQKGTRVVKVDGGRLGEGEQLGPVRIGAGEAYLRVRPLWTAGSPVHPGSETPYSLTIEWHAPDPGWELEPNDDPAQARTLEPGARVEGYLSGPDDRDYYRLAVPAGQQADGTVSGIDGVDIVVLLGERERADKSGRGEGEAFVAAPDASGTVLIGVAERPPSDGDDKALPERDEPYTLRVRLTPAR